MTRVFAILAALPFLTACPGGPEHRWVDGLSYTDACEVQLCWREGDVQTCRLCSELGGALADGIFDDGSGPRNCDPDNLPSHAVSAPAPTAQCGDSGDVSSDEGLVDALLSDDGPELPPEVEPDITEQDSEIKAETELDSGPDSDAGVDCSALDGPCTTGQWTGTECVAVASNEAGPCDDQDQCTLQDSCNQGACVGSPLDCSTQSDDCNLALCQAGACVVEAAIDGTPCDDEDFCTVADSCTAGSCVGTPTPWPNTGSTPAIRNPRKMEVHGTLAAISDAEAGLVLADSTTSPPQVMSVVPLGDWAIDVKLSIDGLFAYVLDFGALTVVDVSKPMAPEIVGSFLAENGDVFSAIQLQDDTISISAGSGGLVLVSVINPEVPIEVGRLATGGYAVDLAVSDGLAIVLHANLGNAEGGLALVDTTASAFPSLMSTLPLLGSPQHIVSKEEHAYVAAAEGGLHIVQVADPAAPSLVGTTFGPSGGSQTVSLQGQYLFRGDALGQGTQVFGLADPNAPVELATLDHPGYCHSVALINNIAVVLQGEQGLWSADVSAISFPVAMEPYSFAGNSRRVFASDEHLFVADTTALRLYDMKMAPTLLSSFLGAEEVLDVAVSTDGTHAYVATGGSGLLVLDVTNTTSPTIADAKMVPGETRAVATTQTHLLTAHGVGTGADPTRGVIIFDITAPGTPESVASVLTPGSPQDIVVSGDFAYVADGGGVIVIDVSTPESPVVAAVYPPLGLPKVVQVAVSGSLLGVAHQGAGIEFVDISNPAAPAQLSLQTINGVRGIAIHDDWAFAMLGTTGISAYDVSTPSTPVLNALISTTGAAESGIVQSGRLFVSDGPVPLTSLGVCP